MSDAADGLKMLLVDDDDVDRERVCRLLKKAEAHVQVSEAESGVQALKMIRAGAYDCIVLDHHLGDVTGAELIRQIQSEPWQTCPIIMVTGAGSESVAVQALMEGASDYLSKTQLSADILLSSIKRALDAHRLRSQYHQTHALLEQQVDQQAQAIRQSEKDLRALVNNAPMAMGYWDASLRCRFGNLCLRDWFQIGDRDLSGLPLHEFLGPSVYQQAREYIDAALQGQVQSFEVRCDLGPDQTARWHLWQLRPDLAEDGSCVGFYATITNITEQHRAREALVSARDSAESAARAKSAFLANMSHEIRTPMNAIVGFSRLVLEDALPAGARSYIEKLHTSSLALMDILDDVLDYSKIEAGFMHLEHTRFDLEDLLQRVADLFQARIEQKKLAFVVDLSPDIPKAWLGDPLRLSQVLTNLVGNAIKFTDKGYISVKVERDEDGSMAPSSCLRFSVEDSGIGMDESTRSRLFEAFIQGDTSITRRFGGTGLGLAICKRLVNLMGGDVAVDSRLGEGSRFSFTVAVEPGNHSRPLDVAADVAGRRMLVVDGNPLSCQVTLRQLKSWRVSTQCAHNVATALAHVERFLRKGAQFDALLIDHGAMSPADVPAFNQLIERITQAGGRLPQVIWLTTQTDRRHVAEGVSLSSPPMVLTKPVLASRLLEALRSEPGRQEYASAPHAPASAPEGSDRLRHMAAPLQGVRILLVEDNELNQIVAREFLTRCGLTVTTVDDGSQAVELIRAAGPANFDAILMDMHMPVLDGLEATRQIKAGPGCEDLPIIGMTAAVLPEDKDRCRAAGMVDHIAKPVIPEVVIAVLRKWVAATNGHEPAQAPDAPRTENGLIMDLADIDLGALRDRLHGNESLVWKLLAAFIDQEHEADVVLSKWIAEGDESQALRKAHDLKGSAANLGLMGVSRASALLQQAIQLGQGVPEAERFFKQVHGRCLQTLRNLLKQAGGNEPR